MITQKRCTRCHMVKDMDKFYRDRYTKDGRRRWCNVCEAEYSRTTASKAAQRKYDQTDAGKAARRKYEQSAAGKASSRRRCAKYRKTEAGKISSKQSEALRKQRHPEKVKARKRVFSAVRTGNMLHVSTQECAHCRKRAEHYHHPDYSEPLDVVPLCEKCHKKEHRER